MTCVIDSSAVIALLWDEPGSELVSAATDGALMSSVNASEVALRLARDGADPRPTIDDLLELGIDIVDFTFTCGLRLMDLRQWEHRLHLTLSLGDRCCLATAMDLGLPVLTADREWLRFDDIVDVQLIR